MTTAPAPGAAGARCSHIVRACRMNRIGLALLLFGVCTAAHGDWLYVSKSPTDGEEFSIYVDAASIRRSAATASAWSMRSYLATQELASGKRFLSILTRLEYACRDERFRVVESRWHNGPMGDGEAVLALRAPDQWKPVARGSIIEHLGRSICGID